MYQKQIKNSFPDIFCLISRTAFYFVCCLLKMFKNILDPGQIVSRNNSNKLMFYALIVHVFFMLVVNHRLKKKAINIHSLCKTILHLIVN